MSKVSIIVSTYSKDRAEHLSECIASLKRQTLSPAEIILVLDPCPELIDFYKLKFPDVKIVVSQEPGLSNARNIGVKNAEGELIAFIDDDAVADEYWLERLVKNYEDPEIIGVGGQIKPLWKNNPKWFPEELNWIIGCTYKGFPENQTSIRNPIGCNMSFRREAFEKVGYFRHDIGRVNRKLLSGEEMEFSVRVLEKIPGSRIVYEPSAIVYHKIDEKRANLRYICKRSFYEGFSKALIISTRKKLSRTLSTENWYLKYLLKTAIPLRLKRFYKIRSILQIFILLISLLMVSLGFLIGKIMSLHL